VAVVLAVVDTVDLGRCTRLFALIARRNVKFLLNPGKIARYIVRNVSQSARTKAVKRIFFFCIGL
jgi:hypothetical protein